MKKSVRIIALILSMCMGFMTGCIFRPSNNVQNLDSVKESKGYITSYPETLSGALHNKGMGWISLEEQTELGKLDLGANGTLPEVDNIGIQTSWALIEKEEGVFDWSLIDKTIEYWTALGKRINLRICTDSLSLPEVFFGAPGWLNDEPYNVDYELYSYSGSVMARANDLTDPTYQLYFERFMQKLSERYADNPYIDTIDIRGYGMFGEWHSGHSFANMQERMFALAYIVDKYAEAFAMEGKTLFLSNSWDYQGVNDDGSSAATNGNCAYEDYLAWSAIDHAMKIDYIGYRRDGMSGNGVTKYATDEKALVDLIRSGKETVNCGEFFTGFSDYINGLYGMDPVEAVEEMIFKSRCNYATVMGWVNIEVVNIVEAGYEEVFNRGNEKMGYRLQVDLAKYPMQVKQGNTAYVLTKISNSGVGRFSLINHNIRLYLVDEAGVIKQEVDNKDYDLRVLLNGETLNVYTSFTVNNSLKDGKYTLAIAIVDENGNPDVRLAQPGNYDAKIYPLGEIEVGNYSQLKPFYEEMTFEQLKRYNFGANSLYELTFNYQPCVSLQEHIMGDENGFLVTISNSTETRTVANFQDVSGHAKMKTVSIMTGTGLLGYKADIYGTGIYENKIIVGKVIVENKTGYMQDFDANYNLLSTKNAWYSDTENAFVDDYDIMGTKGGVLIFGELPHGESDGLISDPALLQLKPNTSYTITFSTKGEQVGGNAAYSYLHLKSYSETLKVIGEWYDRPDEPASVKSFTFTTTDDDDQYLVFGYHNTGAYLIEGINIVQNPAGILVEGDDIGDVNNVRPYDEEKGLGYVEGFENMVLNDCTFTYGFNRWGHLTSDEYEVIDGKFSMSSKLEEETYSYFRENWTEFMYSNPKYIQLQPNTSYRVRFEYVVLEEIVLVDDEQISGYAYIMARSKTGADADSQSKSFAQNVTVGKKYTLIYDFTTGNANDYSIIIGCFGRGNIIIDNISVTEK